MDIEAAPPSYTNIADNDDALPEYTYSFDKPEKPVPAPTYEESFKIQSPKFNDTFFTYTFLATVLLFVYLTYDSYHYLNENTSSLSFNATKLSKPMKALYTLITLSSIIPLLCSFLILSLVYLFPSFFVVLGFLLIPLSLFSMAFSCLITGNLLGALFTGLFGVMALLFLFNNYNRFSFSALMIQLIIKSMKKYPSTLLISVLSCLLTTLVSFIYMISISIIINSRILKDDSVCPHTNGNDLCISNTTIILYIFITFTGCYIFQIIQNTTHVILAGIFSSWYFFETSLVKPKNPSFGSIKRALTYCFGSICFGSLIVSFIQTFRLSLQLIKTKLQNSRLNGNSNSNNDGDYDNYGSSENSLLFCFLICIISLLEWLASEFEYWMKWFNRYAYSYLAMYGKSYLLSSRDTFEIMKFKGIDILINDSLINSAINLYSILSILITSASLYLIFSYSSIGNINDMSPEMLVIGGLGGLIICYFIVSSAINVLDVGCVTFMIGLAVDPDAFTRTDAGGASGSSIERLQAWEKMCRYHPNIRNRVHLAWPDTVSV